MPKHEETRSVPFLADEMLSVVAGVERYPDFLPWCAALRVLKRDDGVNGISVVLAEMMISYHGLRERYTSRVTIDKAAYTVRAVHVKGPFAHLDTLWRFTPQAEGCEVYFSIDFAFSSRILSMLAGTVFEGVARKMTDAFMARAGALYASK